MQRQREEWAKEQRLQSQFVAQKAAEDRVHIQKYGFKGHASIDDWHESVIQNSVKRTMDRI